MRKPFFIFSASITLCLLGVLLFAIPQTALAQATGTSSSGSKLLSDCEIPGVSGDVSNYIRVSIPLPGLTLQMTCKDSVTGQSTTVNVVKDLGTYLVNFYQYFISFVGILATVMIMYGGIRWVLAAGNQSRIQGAKSIISSAIIGLVIALTSYLLLYLLNPELVNYDRLSSRLQSLSVLKKVNQSDIVSCGDMPDGTMVQVSDCGNQTLLTGDCEAQKKEAKPAKQIRCGDVGDTTTSSTTVSAGSACLGVSCKEAGGGGCFIDSGQCIQSFFAGTIEWVGNAYVDKIDLVAICKNGEYRAQLATITSNIDKRIGGITNAGRLYYFASGMLDKVIQESNAFCSDGLEGYALNVEVNDDSELPFEPTTDDNFLVAKNAPIINLTGSPASSASASGFYCTSASINKPGGPYIWEPSAISKEEMIGIINKKIFIKENELTDGKSHSIPFRCDLRIDRQAFPSR